MKATGIVRKLDPLGRIVLPMELRNLLGIKEKDSLEIFVEGEMIILKKYRPGCILCGEMKDVIEIENKVFCSNCLDKIKRASEDK